MLGFISRLLQSCSITVLDSPNLATDASAWWLSYRFHASAFTVASAVFCPKGFPCFVRSSPLKTKYGSISRLRNVARSSSMCCVRASGRPPSAGTSGSFARGWFRMRWLRKSAASMPTRELRSSVRSPCSTMAAVHCTKSRIMMPVACRICRRA